MEDAGLKHTYFQQAIIDNIKLYLEVHIEQGKILESNEMPVGNVTGIAGPLWLEFTLKGSLNMRDNPNERTARRPCRSEYHHL